MTLEELEAAALEDRDNAEVQEEIQDDTEGETEDEAEEETTDDAEDESEDESGTQDSFTEDEDDNGDDDTSDDGSFTPVTVKQNNFDITLNTQEELDAYNNNVNRSKQTIDLSPKTRTKEELALKQSNLTASDLQLLIDAKNGNIGAIKQLLNANKLDIDTIDDYDGSYTPEFQVQEANPVTEILTNIGNHPDLAKEFNSITSNLPKDFSDLLSKSPDDLLLFANHVKDGIAQKVLPDAMKLSIIKGIPLADAYNEVGNKLLEDGNKTTTKPTNKSTKPKVSRREKQLRDKASRNTSGKGSSGNGVLSADDIWDMTPEERSKLTPEQLMD